MYNVFVNECVLILTTQPPVGDQYFVFELKAFKLTKVLRLFKKGKTKKVYLVHKNHDKLLPLFYKKISVVQAAGGIVRNSQGKLLFIFRKGKWDLPKGKVDKGENLEETALREVQEETGVEGLLITGKAPITYHIFKRNYRIRLKETHWYFMTTSSNKKLIPESREGIVKAKWKGVKKTKKALKNSYANIANLLAAVE